jgi:hypothetical protein
MRREVALIYKEIEHKGTVARDVIDQGSMVFALDTHPGFYTSLRGDTDGSAEAVPHSWIRPDLEIPAPACSRINNGR